MDSIYDTFIEIVFSEVVVRSVPMLAYPMHAMPFFYEVAADERNLSLLAASVQGIRTKEYSQINRALYKCLKTS